jgi:hypothetical protein
VGWDWIHLVQDRNNGGYCEYGNEQFYTAIRPDTTFSTTRSTCERNKNINRHRNAPVENGTRNSRNQHKFTQEETTSAVIKTIQFHNTFYNKTLIL